MLGRFSTSRPYASMDDRQPKVTPDILEAVRGGDEAVCRQVVDMLYPLVISIVRNHLPRTEAEEDLSQEIFMKMFSRLKQYTPMEAHVDFGSDGFSSKFTTRPLPSRWRTPNRWASSTGTE